MQRRHLDQRQGGVDGALQRPRMSLSLTFSSPRCSGAPRRDGGRERLPAGRGDRLLGLGGLLVSFLRSSSSALRRAAVLVAAMRRSAMIAPRMVAFTAAGNFFDNRSVQAGSAPSRRRNARVRSRVVLYTAFNFAKGLDQRLSDLR